MAIEKPARTTGRTTGQTGAKIIQLAEIRKRRGLKPMFRLDQLGAVFSYYLRGQELKYVLGLTEEGLLSIGLQTTAMRRVYSCDINDRGLIILAGDQDFPRLLRHLNDRTGQEFRLPTHVEASVIARTKDLEFQRKGLDGFVIFEDEQYKAYSLPGIGKPKAIGIVLFEA